MCVVSMVFDHYRDRFNPWINPQPGTVPPVPSVPVPPQPYQPINIQPTISPEEIKELRKLIGEFREAVKAAKKVDILTDQPDCEDPQKAELEDRVAQIERVMDDLRGILSKNV